MSEAVRDRFLPYSRQSIGEDDIAAVSAALRSDFLTTGPLVEEFEAAFAKTVGARYAVACNSGTAALHLAVLGLDLKTTDVAIVPSITFLATANVVRLAGALVVFCDVDPDSGLMTPETLSQGIERAASIGTPRIVLPVHLRGHVADMQSLSQTARAHGLQMIEDACHALGVNDIGACRHSKAACFSTHAVKAVATGEGGVVTTADAQLAACMKRLRSHGMIRDQADFLNRGMAFDGGSPNPWYYEMHEPGWNYRMPDVLCALGISQLRKLPQYFARRQAIAARYDAALAPLARVLRPTPRAGEHGLHLYAVLIDFHSLGISRRQVMTELRGKGIGTQVHYVPVHRQPYYRADAPDLTLPGADAYYARCLSLPLFPSMTDADVEKVVAAVTSVIGVA